MTTPTLEVLKLHHIGKLETFVLDAAQLVEITGGGEVGKTTVLDAVVALLTGKDTGDLVTKGEKEGWIEGIVAGVKVRRVLNPQGRPKALEILDTRTGEVIVEQKQGYLDTLLGTWIPRPLDIYRAAAKDRMKLVLKAVRLSPAQVAKQIEVATKGEVVPDLTDESTDLFPLIQRCYKRFYDERHDAKKELKRLSDETTSLLQSLPANWDAQRAPEPPAPVGELYEKRNALRAMCSRRKELLRDLRDALLSVTMVTRELDEGGFRVHSMSGATDGLFSYSIAYHGPTEDWEQFAENRLARDESSITEQIDNYEQAMQAYQQAVREYGDFQARFDQATSNNGAVAKLEARVEELESIVAALAELPQRLLRDSGLPMQGLEVREDDLYVDGIPLDERGDSMKRLRFCAEIAMALAPEHMKLVLLDGCESMDSGQRADLIGLFREKGFQAIMTRVTDGQLQQTPLEAEAPIEPTPAASTGAGLWD
jgi:tetratricopeptide (TPR) repeat protein